MPSHARAWSISSSSLFREGDFDLKAIDVFSADDEDCIKCILLLDSDDPCFAIVIEELGNSISFPECP